MKQKTTSATVTTLNDYGVPPCPECGRSDFRAKTALGFHRKTKHGVDGSSTSAVVYRQAKDIPETPASASPLSKSKAKIVCPECGEDHFTHNNVLAYHRRVKHGVIGKTNRMEKSEGLTVRCAVSGCGKWFKNQMGLAIHQSTIHDIPGANHDKNSKTTALALPDNSPRKVKNHATSNGQSPEISRSTEPPLGPEDLLVFQTIGELKAHCRFIAEQAGVPTPQFTARVILALHSQTRR